jgi:2-phospho-L-lactate guanylyltransferase
MILVPVKNLGKAKQRMADVLDQPTRTQFARTMLVDVLHAIASYGREKAALVTSDTFAMEQAALFGMEIISESSTISETDAIAMATRVCDSRAVERTLVLPGDVPLLAASDLAQIYQHAPVVGSVLVPSADTRGSNAVLRSPAGLFPLRFGNDSFWPHVSAAMATGYPCVILPLPRIALDIDTSEDLRSLAKTRGNKASQQLARKLIEQIDSAAVGASSPITGTSTAAKP